jgi:endonuclease/exonuclease/phosphatase family metal-dependent hydrolase
MLKSLLFSLFVFQAAFSAAQFEVVTFNVRWLGLTVDDPRTPNPKPKDPMAVKKQIASMADFMKRVVNPKSIIAFQEVVDLNALRQILPPNWSCDGYKSANIHHQHVVLCVSPLYRIVNVPHDRDKVIEAVATDAVWSRPGVRADIVDRTGKRFLRVVALHLKAAPDFSLERQRQMKVIAQDLRMSPTIPTVLLGDLNSYSAKETGQVFDDVDLFERILKQSDPTFVHLKHKKPFTFRSHQHRSQFDHIYFNRPITVVSGPDVFNVCSQTTNGTGYYDFNYYYENVTDHCAVKAILQIN